MMFSQGPLSAEDPTFVSDYSCAFLKTISSDGLKITKLPPPVSITPLPVAVPTWSVSDLQNPPRVPNDGVNFPMPLAPIGSPLVNVQTLPGKGKCVISSTFIKKGTILCPVVGCFRSKASIDACYGLKERAHNILQLTGLDNVFIDMTLPGYRGLATLINTGLSHEINTRFEVSFPDGVPFPNVFVRVVKDILPGREIIVDYGDTYGMDEGDMIAPVRMRQTFPVESKVAKWILDPVTTKKVDTGKAAIQRLAQESASSSSSRARAMPQKRKRGAIRGKKQYAIGFRLGRLGAGPLILVGALYAMGGVSATSQQIIEFLNINRDQFSKIIINARSPEWKNPVTPNVIRISTSVMKLVTRKLRAIAGGAIDSRVVINNGSFSLKSLNPHDLPAGIDNVMPRNFNRSWRNGWNKTTDFVMPTHAELCRVYDLAVRSLQTPTQAEVTALSLISINVNPPPLEIPTQQVLMAVREAQINISKKRKTAADCIPDNFSMTSPLPFSTGFSIPPFRMRMLDEKKADAALSIESKAIIL